MKTERVIMGIGVTNVYAYYNTFYTTCDKELQFLKKNRTPLLY